MFSFRSHKFALNFNFIECNTMRSKKKSIIKNFSQVSALELKRITAIFIMISRIQKPVAFCCWHHKYTQHVMSLSHHAKGEQRIELFFSLLFFEHEKDKIKLPPEKSFRGWQNLLAHSQWYSISSCQLETYTFECAALITTFFQI